MHNTDLAETFPEETEHDTRCCESWTNTDSRVKRMSGATVASKDLVHVCTSAKPWKSCKAAHDSGWKVFCDKHISGLLTSSVAFVT